MRADLLLLLLLLLPCQLAVPTDKRLAPNTKAQKCPPGSFLTKSHLCQLCPPGSFLTKSHLCQLCPPGTFADRPGQTVCSQCPQDTFSEPGAVACSSCVSGILSMEGDCVQQVSLFDCQQSSQLAIFTGCRKAIDGNIDSRFSGFSCSSTRQRRGAREWWAAFSRSQVDFHVVVLYNRADCCQDRLTNFVVKVDGKVCAEYRSSATFAVAKFNCRAVGSKLEVVSRIRGEPLALCEVQAYGQYLD